MTDPQRGGISNMHPEICALTGSVRWLVALAIGAAVPLTPAASTTLLAADMPVGATLTVLAEPVEVAPVEVGTFGQATGGQSLRPGDVIRTGPSGLALLTFFDGSESQLGSDSQLQIEQADYAPTPHIALLQTGGVTVNRVIPLPPGGSFRTDTPEATGLVRGTSYVVSVGAGSGTAMVLLTDRDGHIGHVQVVPSHGPDAAAPPTVDLVRAGDVGATSSSSLQAPSASHVDGDALARLEQGARDLRDVDRARQAHEQAKQVQRDNTPDSVAPVAAVPVVVVPVVAAPRVEDSPAPKVAKDKSDKSQDKSEKSEESSKKSGGSAATTPAPAAPTTAPAAPVVVSAPAPASPAPAASGKT